MSISNNLGDDDIFFDAQENPAILSPVNLRDIKTSSPSGFSQSVVTGDLPSKWTDKSASPLALDINKPHVQPDIVVTEHLTPKLISQEDYEQRNSIAVGAITNQQSSKSTSIEATGPQDRRHTELQLSLSQKEMSHILQIQRRSPSKSVCSINSGKFIKNLDNGELMAPEELEEYQNKVGLTDPLAVKLGSTLNSSQESLDSTITTKSTIIKNVSGFFKQGFRRSQSDLSESEFVSVKVKHKKDRLFEKLKLIKTLALNCPVSDRAIWVVRCNRTGKHLGVGGKDGIVRIWNLSITGKPDDKIMEDEPNMQLKGHTSDIFDISFSKNNFILSSSSDKTVRLWHISRIECLCVFQHTDYVTAVEFHPKDDRFFLSGCLDGRIRVWNLQEKRVQYWNEIQAESESTPLITAVAFSTDGKLAICGTNSGSCIFYETDGLKYNTQIQAHRKGRPGEKISGIEVRYIGDEEKILVTSNDSRVRTYNMRDKGLSCKFKGLKNESSQIKASFSSDGEYVICGSEDGCAYVWKVDSHDSNDRIFGVRRDRNSGYEKFKVSESSLTCAIFVPECKNQYVITSDATGNLYVFQNQ